MIRTILTFLGFLDEQPSIPAHRMAFALMDWEARRMAFKYGWTTR